MRCSSLSHESTNNLAPSRCNRIASASTSTPARANSVSTASASPPSSAIISLHSPCSAKASRVFSGMVLMVSGAAYPAREGRHAGFGLRGKLDGPEAVRAGPEDPRSPPLPAEPRERRKAPGPHGPEGDLPAGAGCLWGPDGLPQQDRRPLPDSPQEPRRRDRGGARHRRRVALPPLQVAPPRDRRTLQVVLTRKGAACRS